MGVSSLGFPCSLQVQYSYYRSYNVEWIHDNYSGMAADVLIAVVLCFQLKDSRVGFKRTNNVVDRLILCPDHYIVWPETNILMAVLSTLSILAVLNGRPKLREKLMYGSGHDVTWEVGHIPTASGGTLSTTSGQFCSSGTISVHVNGSAQSDDMDKAKARIGVSGLRMSRVNCPFQQRYDVAGLGCRSHFSIHDNLEIVSDASTHVFSLQQWTSITAELADNDSILGRCDKISRHAWFWTGRQDMYAEVHTTW
ncbi:hypothetical protein FISHEDRAFT_54988 [Fistulina hepatica ATCC 64428]|uniref:Uncharacterized protein n=1 Tax=Fistulina hepatica ATCC 64428 TaxID=1128425 RepID=A0A0D7AQD7_9AGAR|nr:hypothetical protein FISHEDRAFT_54988 [Fistulina hepatica ATCC 64428]